MARTGIVLLLGLLLLMAGCTNAPRETVLSHGDQEKIQTGIRDFLGDQNYSVDPDTVSVDKNLFIVQDNQTIFFHQP